jgi:hypothetical protein
MVVFFVLFCVVYVFVFVSVSVCGFWKRHFASFHCISIFLMKWHALRSSKKKNKNMVLCVRHNLLLQAIADKVPYYCSAIS